MSAELIENQIILKDNAKTYEGLTGWLILLGINVIGRSIDFLGRAVEYVFSYNSGMCAPFITPGAEMYHPIWAPMYILEFIIFIGIFLFNSYLLYLFFKKKREFPKYFIRLMIFICAFIFIDQFITVLFMTDELLSIETTKPIARWFLSEFIVLIIGWIYLTVSRRANATFVR